MAKVTFEIWQLINDRKIKVLIEELDAIRGGQIYTICGVYKIIPSNCSLREYIRLNKKGVEERHGVGFVCTLVEDYIDEVEQHYDYMLEDE